MANIHFIGGEKGGVGKSLTARVLAQYMIDKEIPFLGFDTDRSHGALMRFYSGYASPVVMDNYEAMSSRKTPPRARCSNWHAASRRPMRPSC